MCVCVCVCVFVCMTDRFKDLNSYFWHTKYVYVCVHVHLCLSTNIILQKI